MSHVPVLKDLYAKFASGDVPAVLAMLADDVEWREAESNPYQPSGEPWRGPQAVLENLFVKLGSEWDGFTVTPSRFLDAGDRVVVEGRYTGTYRATGKALDAQVCHVWTLRDGRISGFQQYVDTAGLREAMGA
jgi:ketosteroid isomerase-like protein